MSASQSSIFRTVARALRGPLVFTATLLAVELLDELIYGVVGAALPLIRDDLGLTYMQLGLLLAIPSYLAIPLDPVIGLLGDTRWRKTLIVGGALATALAMGLVMAGQDFTLLLVAFCLAYPASTAYVSLSQATLMDLHPGRHDQMMARWTVLGSVGQVAGPALVTGLVLAGLGWRSAYGLLAAMAAVAAVVLWRQRIAAAQHAPPTGGLRATLRLLPGALRHSGLLRWIVLIELADLLLDVFYSFCALYFTDVVGTGPELAGLAVAVLSGSGLIGDLLLVPMLERVDGLRVVRWSAALVLALYVAFLLVPGLWPKLALLALIGPLRSSWYPVLQGRAYSALPGQSGTVIALTSIGGLFTAAYPLIVGTIADTAGLPWAMALLALGPVALLVGLPRRGGDTALTTV